MMLVKLGGSKSKVVSFASDLIFYSRSKTEKKKQKNSSDSENEADDDGDGQDTKNNGKLSRVEIGESFISSSSRTTQTTTETTTSSLPSSSHDNDSLFLPPLTSILEPISSFLQTETRNENRAG